MSIFTAPERRTKEATNAACGTGPCFEMANGGTIRQGSSNVDTFSNAKGILEFNAKVSNSVVDLGVTQQQLGSPKIAGLSIDIRCLCLAERMGAISARL